MEEVYQFLCVHLWPINFPLTNGELMCPFVYCFIYFEFAGIGCPERGGWAWGQAFVRSKEQKEK